MSIIRNSTDALRMSNIRHSTNGRSNAENIRHSTDGRSNVENPTSEEGRFGCRIFDIRRRVLRMSNIRHSTEPNIGSKIESNLFAHLYPRYAISLRKKCHFPCWSIFKSKRHSFIFVITEWSGKCSFRFRFRFHRNLMESWCQVQGRKILSPSALIQNIWYIQKRVGITYCFFV